MQQIAGRAGDNGRLEVDQHRDELGGIAGGDRDHHGADLLRAVMRAQSPGEKSVAVADEYDVIPRDAGHRHAAGHTFRPDIDVPSGVGADLGLARGAAGRVDPHDLRTRHGQKSQRIGLVQILIGGEGKLLDILDPLDIGGLQSHLLHLLAIVLHVVIDAVHQLAEPRALQRLDILPRHALFCFVPDHFRDPPFTFLFAPKSCNRSVFRSRFIRFSHTPQGTPAC